MSSTVSASTVPGTVSVRYSADDLADQLGAHRPTPEQRAVIEAPLEPMLVIAGAGSGKTATMADRVVYLVANSLVRPDQILGVTFTRKAAGELRERITGKLQQLAALGLISAEELAHDSAEGPFGEALAVDTRELLSPAVSTYHSYANTLVAEYGLRIGVEPDVTLIGQAQSWQIVSELVASYDRGEQLLAADQSPGSLPAAVLRLAGDCAEHVREPEEVEDFLHEELARFDRLCAAAKNGPTGDQQKLAANLRVRAETAELARRYQRRKDESGFMDYGDLLRYATRIARDVPEAGAAEREKFRVVLLDEFQDTSYAQLELFAGLYGRGHGHAVTAVGDPHQSIYGFRGASAGQLFSFPEVFPRVDAESGSRSPAPVSQLTVAWRNSQDILSAANRLADPLSRPHFSDAAHRRLLEELRPLVPRPGAGPGTLRLGWYATEKEENAAIVEQLQNASASADDGEQPGITRAVLARTRAQLESIAEALRAAHIPCEVIGAGGLLGTPEINEVLAYLHVVADPNRSDAMMRILAGARHRLGAKDLYVLGRYAKTLQRRRSQSGAARAGAEEPGSAYPVVPELHEGSSLVEAVDRIPQAQDAAAEIGISSAAHTRLIELRDLLRRLRRWSSTDLTSLVERIIAETGLDIEVAVRPWHDRHHGRRQLDRFLEYAEQFSLTTENPDLLAFLSWVEAAEAEEQGLSQADVEPDPQAVQLLTVHASKGLEWDVVVVAGLRDGKFPAGKADRWTGKNGLLPAPLRGDRHSIPQWDSEQETLQFWFAAEGTKPPIKAFEGSTLKDDTVAFQTEEERRLAYVGTTRAREVLIATAACFYGSSQGKSPSAFLEELKQLAEEQDRPEFILHWAEVEDMRTNPQAESSMSAVWPYDPLKGPAVIVNGQEQPPSGEDRRQALERAAQRVRDASAARDDDAATPGDEPVARGEEASPRARTAWEQEAQWIVDRLRSAQHGVRAPHMPTHLSASRYVSMARDPAGAAERARRPLPSRPSQAARRGTAMHAWLEEHFGSEAPLDVDVPEVPGDEALETAFGLNEMKETFLHSPWAQRHVFAMEIPVETTVEGVTLRGRIDAVFGRDSAGHDVGAARHAAWEMLSSDERTTKMRQCSWDLVDWKTGAVPVGEDLQLKSLQLAVYRLAFARLYGVELETISAAFHYVEHNRTITLDQLAGETELADLLRDARRYFSAGPQ